MPPLAVPRRRGLRAALLAGAVVALAAGCAAPSSVRSTTTRPAGRPSPTASTPRPARTPGPVPQALLRHALGCPHAMAAAVGYRAVLPAELPTVVVAAHCVSGAGSPPWGVYVLADAGSGLRVTATLVAPTVDVQVTRLTATGTTVRVRGGTYSTADIPRCCPDLAFDRSWTVAAGHAVRTGA